MPGGGPCRSSQSPTERIIARMAADLEPNSLCAWYLAKMTRSSGSIQTMTCFASEWRSFGLICPHNLYETSSTRQKVARWAIDPIDSLHETRAGFQGCAPVSLLFRMEGAPVSACFGWLEGTWSRMDHPWSIVDHLVRFGPPPMPKWTTLQVAPRFSLFQTGSPLVHYRTPPWHRCKGLREGESVPHVLLPLTPYPLVGIGGQHATRWWGVSHTPDS